MESGWGERAEGTKHRQQNETPKKAGQKIVVFIPDIQDCSAIGRIREVYTQRGGHQTPKKSTTKKKKPNPNNKNPKQQKKNPNAKKTNKKRRTLQKSPTTRLQLTLTHKKTTSP